MKETLQERKEFDRRNRKLIEERKRAKIILPAFIKPVIEERHNDSYGNLHISEPEVSNRKKRSNHMNRWNNNFNNNSNKYTGGRYKNMKMKKEENKKFKSLLPQEWPEISILQLQDKKMGKQLQL